MVFIRINSSGDHCQVFSQKEMTRPALGKISLDAEWIRDRFKARQRAGGLCGEGKAGTEKWGNLGRLDRKSVV